MNRREVLRMLTAGAVLPALTPELLAFYRQAHPGSSYALRTLSSHQNDTVVAMIDQIIPATDTPGAKAARVNEFIDVILTEWASDADRQNFLDGLAAVDKQSNDLFGKDFAAASSSQQLTLLRAMDDAAAAKRPEMRHRAGNTPPERDTQLKGDFFVVFKNITLHGYYTSEIGFTQELSLQIIPGALHGCAPVPAGKA
ncbi:MAG TPA: gluconate 2-dehydrogenase subunit 3 family protein [Candidatus Angelobacter sp.]|nr:gluconate 2-dehydrogenase subunit 3 family protein [Candidatus Angelobacter sp.]